MGDGLPEGLQFMTLMTLNSGKTCTS